MKSRITIEVDFGNNNEPVIQIMQSQSTDVRDNLLQQFLQSLQHTSRWAKFEYLGETPHGDKRWFLRPIKPFDLAEEIKLMQALLKEKSGK